MNANSYVKEIRTFHSKNKLKKQRSWPSLGYQVHCTNCERDYLAVEQICPICDQPIGPSRTNIMLYKNNDKVKRVGSWSTISKEFNQLPVIDFKHNNKTDKVMLPSICNDSSRKNLVSDIDMWLCKSCNRSNTYAAIKCIACKNSKTERLDSKHNDDNNNNKGDSNNNGKGCVSVTKSSSVLSPKTASEKSVYRRSCSDIVSKPFKKSQRFSFANGDENSTKYSYIGITDPSAFDPDFKWICDRCSFAENPNDAASCQMCEAERALSECSITVTKDTVRYTPPKRRSTSESTEYLRQNIDNDFQFLPAEQYAKDEWICKKCTLLNTEETVICIACGGSKIRSLTSTPDTTLKNGEFWSCPRCTLKNTLTEAFCSACKTPLTEISTSFKYNTNTGLYTLNTLPKFPSKDHIISSRRGKPVFKSMTNDRVGKHLFFGNLNDDNVKTADKKSWFCGECTYENSIESPSCEMCQSSRMVCTDMLKFSVDTFSKQLSDVDNSSIVIQAHSKMKQRSELMEHLRQTEEQEALIKWQQIVQYCKEVSI